jgi:hypothetical protein
MELTSHTDLEKCVNTLPVSTGSPVPVDGNTRFPHTRSPLKEVGCIPVDARSPLKGTVDLHGGIIYTFEENVPNPNPNLKFSLNS